MVKRRVKAVWEENGKITTGHLNLPALRHSDNKDMVVVETGTFKKRQLEFHINQVVYFPRHDPHRPEFVFLMADKVNFQMNKRLETKDKELHLLEQDLMKKESTNEKLFNELEDLKTKFNEKVDERVSSILGNMGKYEAQKKGKA